MSLLTIDKRLAKATEAGHIVLNHITLASAAHDALSGPNPLDLKAAGLKDGFYHIVQWKDDAVKPSLASITLPTGVKSDSSVAVVMGTDTDFLSNFWKLTRQYGVKNGFTVVPVGTNIPDTDPETGATTYDNSGVLNVYRSGCFPLWVMRCDESAVIRSKDGSNIVVDYFRILKSGSKNCWKNSSEAEENSPINVKTASTSLRPPQSELFELIRCDIKLHRITISSVEGVIATASDSTIVKKFYFGTGRVSKSEATSYVSVQLSTSARDQGWADQPQAGLYSWFELAILTEDMKRDQVVSDQIKKVDGNPLTWISHSVPITSTYTDQDGPVFSRDHALIKNLEAGNVLAVLACAQYAQWECDVRQGKLNIRNLVARATKTE
ncbi:hypothetical protein GALMADRAFT_145819 [Galerina marginata CBS 339.88]|uniref:Uncharacterized protein n=1 Tax=Galerina marginata (strain CBS 339.88) TaxID=685588 RepID=A0A067SQP8_GALM3|nr:hypothetical protein GALMADRAFT_145819 [Galerina marginata CBS 339.88]